MASTLLGRPTLWQLFCEKKWDGLHVRCERRFDTRIPKDEFVRVMERHKHRGYTVTQNTDDCFAVWLKNRVEEAGGCKPPERKPGYDGPALPVYEQAKELPPPLPDRGVCDACRRRRPLRARTCAGKPLCEDCVDSMPRRSRLTGSGWGGPSEFNNIPSWDNVVRALEEDR